MHTDNDQTQGPAITEPTIPPVVRECQALRQALAECRAAAVALKRDMDPEGRRRLSCRGSDFRRFLRRVDTATAPLATNQPPR